jgi:hypothetical protein
MPGRAATVSFNALLDEAPLPPENSIMSEPHLRLGLPDRAPAASEPHRRVSLPDRTPGASGDETVARFLLLLWKLLALFEAHVGLCRPCTGRSAPGKT